MNKSKMDSILLGLAVVCLAASFIGHASEVIDGLGKALFGVFTIGFFIVRFFGEQSA